MKTTLYGIKNCDSIKKARRYLEENDIDYQFHDYRTDGVDKKLLNQWLAQHGWETVLNKRGTTWRKLDDNTKAATNEKNVSQLLCDHPAMIKRPVLVRGKESLVGFTSQSYDEFLNAKA